MVGAHTDILDAFSRTAIREEKSITESESYYTSELAGPDIVNRQCLSHASSPASELIL